MNFFNKKNIIVLFFITACSSHNNFNVSPNKLGMPCKSLDMVVKNIEEKQNGEDIIGTDKNKTFEVYMTPMKNEKGELSDEGFVILKGDKE